MGNKSCGNGVGLFRGQLSCVLREADDVNFSRWRFDCRRGSGERSKSCRRPPGSLFPIYLCTETDVAGWKNWTSRIDSGPWETRWTWRWRGYDNSWNSHFQYDAFSRRGC